MTTRAAPCAGIYGPGPGCEGPAPGQPCGPTCPLYRAAVAVGHKQIAAAPFLTESGLLFEINRRVLHPLGLALQVEVDDAGGAGMSQTLWDGREDPEGIVFSAEDVAGGTEKLRRYMRDGGGAALDARFKALGFVEQDRPVVREGGEIRIDNWPEPGDPRWKVLQEKLARVIDREIRGLVRPPQIDVAVIGDAATGMIQAKVTAPMGTFVCPYCGHVFEGDQDLAEHHCGEED